jgi:hypothetical protein
VLLSGNMSLPDVPVYPRIVRSFDTSLPRSTGTLRPRKSIRQRMSMGASMLATEAAALSESVAPNACPFARCFP